MKKNFTKIIALAIIVIMVMAIMPIATQVSSLAWDGISASTAFDGGDGSKESPYKIKSADEFAFFANSVNAGETYQGKYIILMAAIDLGEQSWTPIGLDTTKVFSGNFNGNDYIISGLNVDVPSNYSGLFGYCYTATISNLHVEGTYVEGLNYTGGLVAYMTNATTIVNCTVKIDLIVGRATTGGVIGRSDMGGTSFIIGCVSNSKVEASGAGSSFAGGIIGVAGGTEISYCANFGDVSIGAVAGTYNLAGGIIGCQGAASVPAYIYNCLNTGDVSTAALTTKNIPAAGGITGRASHIAFGEIENCFSTGKVSIEWGETTPDATSALAGGLYGRIFNSCDIKNNFTTSSVVVGLDMDISIVNDENSKVLTEAEITGMDAVNKMGLDAKYWIPAAAELPTINFEAVYANYLVELETVVTTPIVDETTKTIDDTTKKPETTLPTTTPTTAAPTTATPGTTKAEKGCGKSGVVIAVAQLTSIICGAVLMVIIKKK